MQKPSAVNSRDVSISSVTDDSETILDASISNEIEVTTNASISQDDIQESLLMVTYLIMCVPTILLRCTG